MHAITDPVQIWTFVAAGNARFTIRSEKTGARYTFKVRKASADKPRFVMILAGPDNEADYQYVGILTDQAELRLTRKSTFTDTSTPVRALRYFLGRLDRDDLGGVEFFHEGRCGRCGRTLTVPESIVTGIGPECAGKVGAA